MFRSSILRVVFAVSMVFAMVALPACSAPENASSASSSSAADQAVNEASSSSAPAAESEISVTVVVDSSAVGNPVSADNTVQVSDGATIFDALMATGLDVVSSDSAYGTYVSSIDGLAEKQHGAMSGWTYMVNGEYPTASASETTVSNGDMIQWVYSTGE